MDYFHKYNLMTITRVRRLYSIKAKQSENKAKFLFAPNRKNKFVVFRFFVFANI
jgi:hypothetical protein